jgi:hypothetical protein
MAGRHEGDTKDFRKLSFAEQARSITATMKNMQVTIEYHIEHSPRRMVTIEKWLAQVDRLRRRLRDRYHRQEPETDTLRAAPAVERLPRLRVGSPRLARPEQAVDFTMEVSEESRDAGL